ncbi:hypothetical protein LSAT2_014957 [Lamellibrachia satsuma]|nr:hypothetical protein LSAT2_014957 [Lamellibrachia satsuma]
MTSSYLSCGCNHLSTFGGRFFVPPVQVDIFKFSLLQTIWTNSVVPSAVLVAWGIYVMLVVWARHRDQKDNVKLRVTYLAGNAVNAEYYYWVAILTGIRGTTGESLSDFDWRKWNQRQTCAGK